MTSIRNLYKKTNTQTGLGAGLNLGTWDNSGTFTTGTAFDGNDSKMIIPKVTTAVRTASTPLVGEIIYDTDDDLLYRGDGVTLGGVVVGGASAFSDLTDVDTTGLQTGQQMKWTGTVWVPSSTREVLTANRTYYVRTDGNDSNDGLSNTAGGAFLTIQKAIDVAVSLDSTIYDATVSFTEDFTLTDSLILKQLLGSGWLTIDGNGTGEIISSNTVGIGLIKAQNVKNVRLKRLKTNHSVSASDTTSIHVYALGLSSIELEDMEFGSLGGLLSLSSHILANFNAFVRVTGSVLVSGGNNGANTNGRHLYTRQGGVIQLDGITTFTLSNTPAFSVFASSESTGIVVFPTNDVGTISGTIGSGTKRYDVTTNGLLLTYGGTSTTLPGTVSGTTATGGQYL